MYATDSFNVFDQLMRQLHAGEPVDEFLAELQRLAWLVGGQICMPPLVMPKGEVADRKLLNGTVKLHVDRGQPVNIEVRVVNGTLLEFDLLWGSMLSRRLGICASLNQEKSTFPRKICPSVPPSPSMNLTLVQNSTTRRRFGLPHGNRPVSNT